MDELLEIWKTLTDEEKTLVLLFAMGVQDNEKESHGNRLSSLS